VGRLTAVLLDVLGTLLRLEPPGPRLRSELARRGIAVGEAAAERAFRAEIGFYLAHHLEGRDSASLESLRTRCADTLAEALATAPGGAMVEPGVAREALLASLRFEPYDDAEPVLEELRSRGLTVVAVSNWDCSLPVVLAAAGLGPLLDVVVSSALAGAPKPEATIFRTALAIAGCEPERALHVGDSPEHDLAGAAACGIPAVLIERDGRLAGGHASRSIRSLAELATLI
jgi:putative hydrolase of the HAD superfamily